jgi:hypothetical protein
MLQIVLLLEGYAVEATSDVREKLQAVFLPGKVEGMLDVFFPVQALLAKGEEERVAAALQNPADGLILEWLFVVPEFDGLFGVEGLGRQFAVAGFPKGMDGAADGFGVLKLVKLVKGDRFVGVDRSAIVYTELLGLAEVVEGGDVGRLRGLYADDVWHESEPQ